MMHGRVEKLEYVLSHGDGVGNEHMPFEQIREPLPDEGLPGAGGAVEKDRPAGVHGGAKLIQQAIADMDIAEGPFHSVLRHQGAVDRLGIDHAAVVLERHGGGPHVTALHECIERQRAAALGQRIA